MSSIDESRLIQQCTFDLITKSSEIDKLITVSSPNVKEIIDAAVRKVADAERIVDRYQGYLCSPTVDSKHSRLVENFKRAKSKLEQCVARYSESRTSHPLAPSASSGTQLRVMNPELLKGPAHRQPLSSYDYISSIEEGNQTRTLQDLNRVHKEMSTLQDIYYTLSETAQSQHTLIDTVSSKLSKASEKVSDTVKELGKAKERLDYWTRIKLYVVSGVAAVGLVIWFV